MWSSSRLKKAPNSNILWMLGILHDFVYQALRNYARQYGTYIRLCRLLCHQQKSVRIFRNATPAIPKKELHWSLRVAPPSLPGPTPHDQQWESPTDNRLPARHQCLIYRTRLTFKESKWATASAASVHPGVPLHTVPAPICLRYTSAYSINIYVYVHVYVYVYACTHMCTLKYLLMRMHVYTYLCICTLNSQYKCNRNYLYTC